MLHAVLAIPGIITLRPEGIDLQYLRVSSLDLLLWQKAQGADRNGEETFMLIYQRVRQRT